MEKNSRCGRESSVEWKPLALYVQASFLPRLFPDLRTGLLWVFPVVGGYRRRTVAYSELRTGMPVSEWPRPAGQLVQTWFVYTGCIGSDWICQWWCYDYLGKSSCGYGTSCSLQLEVLGYWQRTMGTGISGTSETVCRGGFGGWAFLSSRKLVPGTR